MRIRGETRRSWRAWARRAALIAGSLCAGLLVLEIGLRVFGVEPSALPYDNNRGDPMLGMKPEPNKRFLANFPEYPGEMVVTTNNLSLYDEADTQPLPAPGMHRIAIVGDSFVVGACPARENFPNQLESLLDRAAGATRYEVLDAGVGRYSPYQYFLRAERDILPLEPERLVVAIYVGNDFLDIIRQDDRPYLTRAPNGGVEAHPPEFISYSDPTRPPTWYESSRVWSCARAALGPTILYQISRVRILRRNLSAIGRGPLEIVKYMLAVKKLDRISHGLMAQSLHQYVWFQKFPETLPDALFFNRDVIRRFEKLCRERKIRLTYVIIPSKPVIESERMHELFDALTAHDPKLTATSLIEFENRLADETLKDCAELGVAAIDLRPGLAAAARDTELYYPLDMHLNVAGNRIAAEILAHAASADSGGW